MDGLSGAETDDGDTIMHQTEMIPHWAYGLRNKSSHHMTTWRVQKGKASQREIREAEAMTCLDNQGRFSWRTTAWAPPWERNRWSARNTEASKSSVCPVSAWKTTQAHSRNSKNINGGKIDWRSGHTLRALHDVSSIDHNNQWSHF